MNVVLSQKRVIRSHSNFLRSLHSWTRPPKKFLETLYRSRLGDFWGRRKKLKGEYLVEGHSYRSDTSPVTSHQSSTPSVFFSNFYSHCSRCNDVINFGENPLWGNFQTSFQGPPSLFSILSMMNMFEIEWDWQLTVLKSSILEKKVGGNEFTQLQFTPFFEIFKLIFQFFFKLNTFEMNGADVAVKPHFRKLHRGGH